MNGYISSSDPRLSFAGATIKKNGILLIGAGGLGSAVALALADAGCETLTIADGDEVELSNLQRQLLFTMATIGQGKAQAATSRLAEWLPRSQVTAWPYRLEGGEPLRELFRPYEVIVDGSDNFSTRFAVHDAAMACGVPLVHGAVTGWRGQVITILPGQSTCLRCIFPAPPPDGGATCQAQGVIGPVAGEIGWLMAMEAIRLLRHSPPRLVDGLLTVDGWRGVRRQVAWPPDPNCLWCGQNRSTSGLA